MRYIFIDMAWDEYLLEGLMIFVAVTLGYGAENIREHYVETKKAIYDQ